jgi:hypothetical protein
LEFEIVQTINESRSNIGLVIEDGLALAPPERRRTPRYPFIAEAEVTETASSTKLKARISDLGIGGCFLDMLNPSPHGTDIWVRISRGDSSVTARGNVVFVHPNMGMGVVFTAIEIDQLMVLQAWLAELSGGNSRLIASVVPALGRSALLTVANILAARDSALAAYQQK